MENEKNALFRRNVFGSSTVEFFWGLGFPIVLESTFLQLFLKNLGASGFAVGIVPSLYVFGISCFPLLASYYSRNVRFKRTIVLALHLACGLAVMLFGALLLIMKSHDLIIPVFFFCYALFSISMGMTVPVWLNYLVQIFPEARTVSGLGYMMLAQNCGKIIASVFIVKTVERYSFSPESSAVVFLVTGALFSIGALCFMITREVPEPGEKIRDVQSFWRHTISNSREIIANRPFLVYLAADIDYYVILTVMSFYANYASGYYGVAPAIAAGGFVACIYAGSVTVNVLLGTMNLLSLKQKFLASKAVTIIVLLMLVAVPCLAVFFAVSFLLGFVRATHNMVYPPAVKKFSGKPDVTPYFSLAPIISLPFAAGFPLLFGRLLDMLAPLQAGAYKLLFGGSILFVLVALWFGVQTAFPEDRQRPDASTP